MTDDKTMKMEAAGEELAAEELDKIQPKGSGRRIAVIAAIAAVVVVIAIGIAACATTQGQGGDQPQQEAPAQKSSSSSQSQKSPSSQKAEEGKGGEPAGDDQSGSPEPGIQDEQWALQGEAEGASQAPEKHQVWVVDVPASSTVIHHDAIMTQEPGGTWTMCTVCGADVTGHPGEHAKQHTLEGITNASWTTVQKDPVDVVLEPAWDEVVETPEQGHWEWR